MPDPTWQQLNRDHWNKYLREYRARKRADLPPKPPVKSRTEIAAEMGVSERTLYRWLNQADNPKPPPPPTLLPGETTRDAAKRLGVSERTVFRWLKKERAPQPPG